MVTLTGLGGFTTMVIALDVAGFPEAQVRLDVTVHVMIFPLTGFA